MFQDKKHPITPNRQPMKTTKPFYREKHIQDIAKIYPQYCGKQIAILEKYVNLYCIEIHRKTDKIETTYKSLWYDILGHLGPKSTISDLKECIKLIYTKKILKNHSIYDTYRDIQDEEDHFLLHPFTIEEGVLECSRCGSKRTISYQKQTRSADEGSTTFAKCVDCKKQWRHNN